MFKLTEPNIRECSSWSGVHMCAV